MLDISRTQVSKLTEVYKASHFARRVCQLICFTPLFLITLALFETGLDILNWGLDIFIALLPDAPPAGALTLDALADALDIKDLIALLLGAAMFVFLSNLRRAIWVLPIGLTALSVSLFFDIFTGLDYDSDPVARSNPDMAIALSYSGYMFVGLTVAMHAFFAWLLFKGSVSALPISPGNRSMLSELRETSETWRDTLKSLVNIPEANRYARRRYWTGFLMTLAGLANFMNFWRTIIVLVFLTLLPVIAVEMFPNIGVVIRALIEGRNLARVVTDLNVVITFLALCLAVIMAVPYLIKIVARWCIRRSEEQMRTSLEEVQHLDNRAPILFLRSFVNDKVPLPKGRATLTRWLFDDAGAMDTLDMMILAQGTRQGPTVALGNPDDPAPPYGVARGYFDHDDWKDAVSRLCEASMAIVMVLDETEGVDWEINHIATRKYTAKTLFLLAPEDVGTKRGHTLLGGALARATRTDESDQIAQISDENEGPVFGFQLVNGRPELLSSAQLEKYDYLVALRMFLRGLDADDTLAEQPHDAQLTGVASSTSI